MRLCEKNQFLSVLCQGHVLAARRSNSQVIFASSKVKEEDWNILKSLCWRLKKLKYAFLPSLKNRYVMSVHLSNSIKNICIPPNISYSLYFDESSAASWSLISSGKSMYTWRRMRTFKLDTGTWKTETANQVVEFLCLQKH